MASWLDRAVCKGQPVSMFFWAEDTSKTYARGKAAKAICAECPVTHECLEDALTVHHRDQFGVYGGKTALERQHILESRLLRSKNGPWQLHHSRSAPRHSTTQTS